MPELPEVETTCRGISPHISGQKIQSVIIRQPSLRWPVSAEIEDLSGATIHSVTRRAKYLLISISKKTLEGTLLIHLGMSGSLRVIDPAAELRKHDHVLIALSNGLELRYHDPRRFGCMLWTSDNPAEHNLIASLGPEPLSGEFSTAHLHTASRKRKTTIKQVIMDGKVVVGVGNIYACEALFKSGISPLKTANTLTRPRLEKLTKEIKHVLSFAIEQGGTTLRDFLREDGTAGYFKQELTVYDRKNQPCLLCESIIQRVVIGQRSTFFCPTCQK